jgi:hypothetical protein
VNNLASSHRTFQLQDKVHDREEHVRRAQRLTTETQIRAETVESDLRKSNQVRAQDLNKRLAALEIELAEERNVKKVAEYQSKSVIAELTAEFEVQRSELTRILREKDVLHEKVRDLETKYDTDKKQSTTYRKETTGTISALERTIREMKMRIADYEAKMIVAKSTELDNQFAAQMLKASAESLKAEQTAAVEALKRESYLKVTDLEKTYVDKLERIKENTRDALDKVTFLFSFRSVPFGLSGVALVISSLILLRNESEQMVTR